MVDILLVEDDPRLRLMLVDVLSQARYRVTATGDGLQAIRLLANDTVSSVQYMIVISDIRLGATDGIQILEHARARHQPPSVILITGYGTLETAIAALRAGAFDYLVKPFNPNDLLACVSRAIKQQSQDLRQSEAIRTLSVAADQLQSISLPAEGPPKPAIEPVLPIVERLVIVGEVMSDRYRHLATFGTNALQLTPIEYALLLCLAELQGRVVPYADIVRRTHQSSIESSEAQAMLKVHVHNLRRKLEPSYLVNVRGAGYMLAVPTIASE